MQQPAWWMTILSGGVVALVGGYFARGGGLLTRRTDVDKIYSARIESLEKQVADRDAKNDELRDRRDEMETEKGAIIEALQSKVQELREQHISDLGARQKLTYLEEENAILRRKLKSLDAGDEDNIGL